MMTTRRLNPLRELSAGEIAFDRCLIPFVSLGILSVLVNSIARIFRESSDHPGSAWWVEFAYGLLLAAFWVWAFRSVIRAWSDPVTRVLRFSSAMLLTGQFLRVVFLFGGLLRNWEG